jgi:hypothetical protein
MGHPMGRAISAFYDCSPTVADQLRPSSQGDALFNEMPMPPRALETERSVIALLKK